MTSSKQCGQCKAQKSAADFHKDKTKPDGLHCAANLRVIPGSENSGKRNQVNGDEYLILAEIEQEGFKAWLLEQEGLRA